MRRIIKFSVLGETAITLKKQLDELKNIKNQLLLDINKISDGYKGNDANIIIGKYKSKLNQLNDFIQTLEKYQICFEYLSGNYGESYNQTCINLESILPNDELVQTVASETINLNDISGGIK